MTEELSKTLAGTVEKIIQSSDTEPEKAQISIPDADALHRKLRIVNTLTKEDGDEVSLNQGAEVKIRIEASHPKASL